MRRAISNTQNLKYVIGGFTHFWGFLLKKIHKIGKHDRALPVLEERGHTMVIFCGQSIIPYMMANAARTLPAHRRERPIPCNPSSCALRYNPTATSWRPRS